MTIRVWVECFVLYTEVSGMTVGQRKGGKERTWCCWGLARALSMFALAGLHLRCA